MDISWDPNLVQAPGWRRGGWLLKGTDGAIYSVIEADTAPEVVWVVFKWTPEKVNEVLTQDGHVVGERFESLYDALLSIVPATTEVPISTVDPDATDGVPSSS